jgi:hypothetical protein
VKQYDLDRIRQAAESLPDEHDAVLAEIVELSDAVLARVLRCCELAAGRPESEKTRGTFLFAYHLLAAKAVSHAESILALTRIGRYGDASMIIRGLIGDQLMTQYLSIHPDECADWLEMSDLREAKPIKGTRFAQLRGKFSEPIIRKAIEKSGGTTGGSEVWGVYSESAHPSAWGFRFYGVQEEGQLASFRMTYVPIYQLIAAFRCAAMIAVLLLGVANDFYYWMHKTGQDWPEADVKAWPADSDSLLAQVTEAFDWLEKNHVKIFGDPRASE